MKKLLYSLGLFCVAVTVLSGTVQADTPDIPAKAAIAVELSTGKILYDKNANEALPIASLTKLLAIYLVYQDIKEGRLTWDTSVPISDYAYSLVINPDISNPPMAQKPYTVRQLVEASLVVSANSACIALAEKIAGSEPAFVDRMRALLNSWGIHNHLIVTVTGLNNEALPPEHRYPNSAETDENRLSAKDMARVVYQLLTDFPEILDITKQAQLDFDGTLLTSTNKFLTGLPKARAGVDGLKTGTTDLAGQTLVTTSVENHMRLITVLLNAQDADENPYARFDATSQLLDYLGQTYTLQTIWQKGKTYHKQQLPIRYGKSQTLPVVADDSLTIVTSKDAVLNRPVKIISTKNHQAPITKGQLLGTALLNDPLLIGDGYLIAPPQVSLLAKEATARQADWEIWLQDLLEKLPF